MSKKGRPQIKPGYQWGRLTVVEATEQRKNGYTVWRCKCDCGGEALMDTRLIQRGTAKDCGCRTRVKPGIRDLTGQRFGRLTVCSPTDERYPRGGHVIWRCSCDCGNEVCVPSRQLTSGYTKSCGCLSHPPLKDFVGRRFGQLTVAAYAGKRAGMHRWLCVCDCGNETVVGQTLLETGKTSSCGCMRGRLLRDSLGLSDGTSVRILEYYQTHLNPRNTSGYTGVYKHKKTQKWCAQIIFCNKTTYLGSYERKEDAIKARRRAEEEIDAFLEQYYAEHPEWKKARPEKAV